MWHDAVVTDRTGSRRFLLLFPKYKNTRSTSVAGVTGVFGTPVIAKTCGSRQKRVALGSTARFFGALAGLFGALLGALLGALFSGFLGALLGGFLQRFLSGLLGGFLGCFFRHNNSPESRGFKNETQANCFVPLVMVRLRSH